MAHHSSHASISTINTAVSFNSTNPDTLIHVSQCPRIILDSTCNLFTSTIQTPSQLLNRLRNLPIPITSLDLSPRTETNIGAHVNETRVGTKVRVLGSSIGTGKGELRSHHIRESVLRSLATTHASKLDYLIAQRVDHEVSVGEVAGGFGGLVCEDIIDMWGVRLFPLRDLQNVMRVCERRGYHKPRVYQMEYNVLSRPRDDLVEYLRHHGMIVHAYAPTASGFLRQIEPLNKMESNLGEFPAHLVKRGSSLSQYSTKSNGKSAWRGIYDTMENREAVKKISDAGTKYDATLHSASLRWLAYHSRLSSNDSIVVSASSWWDLEDQIGELVKGPLSEELVNVIEEAAGPMQTRGAKSSC